MAALVRIQSNQVNIISLNYLIKSVNNNITDIYRKDSKMINSGSSPESLEVKLPMRDAARSDERAGFDELMGDFETLTNDERNLLESVFMLNMKPSEVAKKLGVSKWAIYKQLERLLVRLRTSLK